MANKVGILKWSVRAVVVLILIGLVFDIGYSLYNFADLRKNPPLESEFRAVQVGMSKTQVRQIFSRKVGSINAFHFEEDGWSFSGPVYCYMIAFDPNSHLVAAKHRTYPPSCVADVEPRGLIVRWLWQKYDELR